MFILILIETESLFSRVKIFLTMFILILMETESVATVTQRFNFREKNNSSLHNSKFFLRYLF